MGRVGKIALGVALALGLGGGAWFYFRPGTEEASRPERPPTPVVLAEARQEEILRRVEAVGTVAAVDSVTVATATAGRITEIEFEQGQRVEEGAVLARLDPAEQQAELLAARAEAAEIEQAVERGEQLLHTGNTPRATVEDARRRLQAALARMRAAESRLRDTEVRAPFAGRVGLRRVSVGSVVQAGTALTTLDAVDPIALRFTVPEQEMGRLRPGAPVEVTSPAFPERRFEGRIHALDGRVDPATRTLEVEARLPNPDGELRPGMLVNLRVATERVADAVTVPPRAVQLRGTTHFVYRERDGKAERAEVRIGIREPERMEILEGLSPGDRVVVEGGDQVGDGQPINPREEEAPAGRDGATAQAGPAGRG
ncbi:efflux RND transporter periplasmic adaptor subunit [Roseomonas sp. SSH11]|uniref:Efflux RND transporter periplasmic adaptor subunit n=1 Tax=Pararoseomonas baculiformis TaxID=2820812 RepID=A0ABS4AAS2_9PROT|nr:efflux RND transporter periplasmic adaptor subunit [Pararoseomonas baculiformis]MBP0443603.1 efflux RND transporter periplasmic adaptor subunit [Pararoseomonas baculiformis]